MHSLNPSRWSSLVFGRASAIPFLVSCVITGGCGTEPGPVGVRVVASLARVRDRASGSLKDSVIIDIARVLGTGSTGPSGPRIAGDRVLLDGMQLPVVKRAEDTVYFKSSPPDSLGFRFDGDYHSIEISRTDDYPGFADSVRLPLEPRIQYPQNNQDIVSGHDVPITWERASQGDGIDIEVNHSGSSGHPRYRRTLMSDPGSFTIPADVLPVGREEVRITITRKSTVQRNDFQNSHYVAATASEIIRIQLVP